MGSNVWGFSLVNPCLQPGQSGQKMTEAKLVKLLAKGWYQGDVEARIFVCLKGADDETTSIALIDFEVPRMEQIDQGNDAANLSYDNYLPK